MHNCKHTIMSCLLRHFPPCKHLELQTARKSVPRLEQKSMASIRENYPPRHGFKVNKPIDPKSIPKMMWPQPPWQRPADYKVEDEPKRTFPKKTKRVPKQKLNPKSQRVPKRKLIDRADSSSDRSTPEEVFYSSFSDSDNDLGGPPPPPPPSATLML